MSKRRLFLSLTAAAALTASACGPEAEDAAPIIEAEQLTSNEQGGSLGSAASPGTSQAPATAQSAPESGERPTSDKPAAQPAGNQTRLGSSVLAATLDPATQTSARFAAHIELESAEFPEPIVVTLRGGFDLPNEASEMELDFSGMQALMDSDEEFSEFNDIFADPMRMITIGDEAWMQWGFLSFLGVEEGHWLAMDTDGEEVFDPDDLGFGNLGSPDELLDSMKDLDATIEEVGVETIHGVETRHLRATIDPSALTSEERADFEENFGQLPPDAMPIDFWVGEDGLLYRFAMSLEGSGLDEEVEFESFSFTFDMFDYGADLGITPPDPSLVVDEGSLGLN